MRHLVNLCEQAAGLRDIHTNSILIASILQSRTSSYFLV